MGYFFSPINRKQNGAAWSISKLLENNQMFPLAISYQIEHIALDADIISSWVKRNV